ncbi:MAG: AraC family transcriptional regulator, partial [Lachnospiraceae bacterium]|nr:AraC family transcriptional regulator [Lachnospiraceae bacterium]
LGMCVYLLVNLQKQLQHRYPDAKQNFEFSCDKLYQFDSIRQLRQWIIEILVDYSRLLASNTADQDDIIHIAKEYIQNNLGSNIKAKDVARQVHLSESYFTIYFKNKTGINFRDYLLNARMKLAQKLLASKDANIGEIAYQIGYQDYRSFSRAFKNEIGMSPSEYMNSL